MCRISAAVWQNETETGVAHNVTIERRYLDGDPWKSSTSFGRSDLPLVAKVSDIRLEPVEGFIRSYCEKHQLGPRTYNHYIQAIDGFCNWMLLTRRIAANPLLGLERLNAEVDVRRERRALSAEEVQKLVASARESGEEIPCFDGETRARLYILAYFTGLRRRELASLTPASFRLEAERPTVTVEAACSKHRRKDVLPLHPELVGMLREWFRSLDADEPLFPKLEKRRTWLMVKLDLERVGIPYETPEGVADFHAAGRHTYITELLRSGVSLVEARELARHSDVRMTMKYTHIGLDDQAQAVAKLPGLGPVPTATSATPAESAANSPKPEACPRPGHARAVSACQNASTNGDSGLWEGANKNPCGDRGYRQKAAGVTDGHKWRRRESKERLSHQKHLQNTRLQQASQPCLHYVCTKEALPVCA